MQSFNGESHKGRQGHICVFSAAARFAPAFQGAVDDAVRRSAEQQDVNNAIDNSETVRL